MRKIIVLLLLLVHCSFGYAEIIALRDHHPNRYVVQQGDTLWQIANKFLQKPWQWKKIWRNNPHIKNPDKIYPGAVLELHQYNGYPAIEVTRKGTIRLSPRIRKEAVDDAILAIPLNIIRPFLTGSQVVNDDLFYSAPYIFAFANERMLAAAGSKVYVTGLGYAKKNQAFSIYRKKEIYLQPKTAEFLGLNALYIGDAVVVSKGEPATLLVTKMTQDVHAGDRILTTDKHKFSYYFLPQPPTHKVDGVIIGLFDGITQVGGNQVVAINRGAADRLAAGDVLAIYNGSEIYEDPHHKHKVLEAPNERIGELMVFRTFDRVSFALVMRATHPIRILDWVTNP